MRPDKRDYYLNIALSVAERGTCLRRNYGAVIVNGDEIVSTGYSGPPRGSRHCVVCERARLNIPSGERYELCRSVHAEANAIISAARRDMVGATLYLAGKADKEIDSPEPCAMCKRLIINSGISTVVTRSNVFDVARWVD